MVDFHVERPERSQAKMSNFDARSAQRQLSAQSGIDASFIVNDDRNVATRPPFTCITTANGTSSETATALAAILKGDLFTRKIFRFWYGSAACRACQSSRVCGLEQDDNVLNATVRSTTTAIVDSGAEIHVVCPAHKHIMTCVTKQQEQLQLETAGGDLIVDTVGGLICGSVVCRGGLFNSPAQNRTDTSVQGVMRVMACCCDRLFIQCSCLARWNVDNSARKKTTLNICGRTSGFRPRMHHMQVRDHARSAIRTSGRRGDGRHGKRSLR